MKTKNIVDTIALSGLLFSGLSTASGLDTQQVDDLLHGNRPVTASAGMAWTPGRLETQQSTDLVYGDSPVEASDRSEFERVADDREFSTDIIYGS